MTSIFIIILFVFVSCVSAFMNATFFHDFASSSGINVFLCVGASIAFDLAKTFAPIVMKRFLSNNPLAVITWLTVWVMGTSVSLFSAVGVIDSGAGTISMKSDVLTTIESSIASYEKQIAVLEKQPQTKRVVNDISYLTTKLNKEREAKKAELKNPTSQANKSFLIEYARYFGMGVASLLELIGLACGLAIGSTKKVTITHKQTAFTDNVTIQDSRGLSKDKSPKLKELSVLELVALLRANSDENLSFNKMRKKYGVGTEKVKEAKRILAGEEEKPAPVDEEKQSKVINFHMSQVPAFKPA